MANIKEGGGAGAGSPTTTVSHVINETRFVAEETRERVFAAMREPQLCPQPGGPQPQGEGRPTASACWLPPPATPSSPRWCAQGVERYCFEQGYNLMLGNTEGQAETALSTSR